MKLLFFFLVVFTTYSAAQNLQFIREDITFYLNSDEFKVEGFYWFTNASAASAETLIFYPFPKTENRETIDSASVFNIGKTEYVKILDLTREGFYFKLKMNAGDTTVYRIFYNQKVLSDSVKYILRTTGAWDKPLENAEYKLVVSDSLKITGFSYKPDKFYNIADKIIYYWKRTAFLPDHDMVFHFSK